MRVGAGLVTLGVGQSINTILESQVLEVMTEPLPDLDNGHLGESALDRILDLTAGKQCLALGPGLGQAKETRSLVTRIIQNSSISLVIDADGLNNLAGHTQILKELQVPVILTPHPGEMARLSETSAAAVQTDRMKSARDFAFEFNAHVILKGAGTVIAHPDGSAYINSTGNPGMAAGGMGDVLTGVIAGLITQGFSPESPNPPPMQVFTCTGRLPIPWPNPSDRWGIWPVKLWMLFPGRLKNCLGRKPDLLNN
jgi:NAD(P)H-hydrate epimerase